MLLFASRSPATDFPIGAPVVRESGEQENIFEWRFSAKGGCGMRQSFQSLRLNHMANPFNSAFYPEPRHDISGHAPLVASCRLRSTETFPRVNAESNSKFNREYEKLTMKSVSRFRRLFIAGIAASLVVAALAGTKFGSKPVAAQVTTPQFDVFVFHCALIPNQALETSNLGSFNLTFTQSNVNFTQPSDCSQVMRDALNAGYHLKSELALPNGTGATEYVFVKGGS